MTKLETRTQAGLRAAALRFGAVIALGAVFGVSSPVGAQPAPTAPPSAEDDPAASAPDESAPTASPRAPDPTMPTGDPHDHKLRELEEKVIGLKERVFRSKTRLLLLRERILNDVIAEAKVVIFHENDMGASLRPVQVTYHLDGEQIYFQDDSSKILDEQDSIEIFNQNLVPGNHVLAVEMVYRGDSAIFAYLDDYLFRLRANYTFYATKGKITTVRAIGYQRGDITYDLRERPSITFDVKQVSYTRDEAGVTTEVGPTTDAPEPSGD